MVVAKEGKGALMFTGKHLGEKSTGITFIRKDCPPFHPWASSTHKRTAASVEC